MILAWLCGYTKEMILAWCKANKDIASDKEEHEEDIHD
jgi:hypothetical protein